MATDSMNGIVEYINNMNTRIVAGDKTKLHEEVMRLWLGKYAILAPENPESSFNEAINKIEGRYYQNTFFR